MPKIREIEVRTIGVPSISVGAPIPPPVLPAAPPVTSTAFPIIDMPGCVRARIGKGTGVQTYEDDERGTVTLCDGTVPVFEAPDYRPNDFKWVQPPKTESKKPEQKAPAVTPSLGVPGADPDTSRLPPDPPCPPFGAKEIGSFNKLGTEVLAGYELKDGKCVTLWDPVPVAQVINNYVPDAGPTVSVAVTAAFATTAAILSKPIASVLQKLVKPITKKVVKKLLLKKEKPVSLRERILAQRDRNRALMALRRAVGK